IIYLGGLGSGDDLSPHLKTRHQVGKLLRESAVETIEFRASIIIGSGSLSFEMVRALVDRLPVMITPRWVSARAQPIAIEDVLEYLISAIEINIEGSRVFEIGGPDVVSYMDIMRDYASKRGLKRIMIPVPVLTPYLSSLWLGLVTPLYARVGRKLVDSIRNDTLVENDDALSSFAVKPLGLTDAIDRALKNEDEEFSQTRWSDALFSAADMNSWGGVKVGNRVIDSRRVTVNCSPAQAFTPIQRIGGKNGWYFADWIWSLRGFIDLLVGGVGARRGRSNPETIAVGDALDFWRVEAVEPNKLLRLRAEMKLPGRAWLQFEVEGYGDCSSIQQTVIFDPIGIFGLLYWYGLYPVHRLVFSGMLKQIANRAAL
ncbi:NAD(P)-dependent oxidoreductase, partial [bacterium J17]